MKTIEETLDQNPDFNYQGWRYRTRCPIDSNDCEKFARRRQGMLTDSFVREVQTVVAWLEANNLPAVKYGSYFLKHEAERWGRTVGLASYVSNGAAICAALMLGYQPERWPNSPNSSFSRPKTSRPPAV